MIVAETAVAGERPVLVLLILDLLHQLLDLHHLLRELRRRDGRYTLRVCLRKRAGAQQRDQTCGEAKANSRQKDKGSCRRALIVPAAAREGSGSLGQPAGARPDRHRCCSSLPPWVAARQVKTSSSTG